MPLARMMGAGAAWSIAVAAILAVGVVLEPGNGAITVLGDISSFITPLGSSAVARGVAYVATGAISVAIIDEAFLVLFYGGRALGLPAPLWIVGAAFVALAFGAARRARQRTASSRRSAPTPSRGALDRLGTKAQDLGLRTHGRARRRRRDPCSTTAWCSSTSTSTRNTS